MSTIVNRKKWISLSFSVLFLGLRSFALCVCTHGGAARQVACELQTSLKFIQFPKWLIFWFFSSSFFTIDFKICLYGRCVDTSYCPHDIFWLHFANSSKLWENKNVKNVFSKFWRNAKCSQNMSCGQCEVLTHLPYRHILKSIVKKLEEKNQKISHFWKLNKL